jgi:putative acetyltransferase
VNVAAFGRAAEADLVEALRRDGAIACSLVAETAGEIVGHVVFSAVAIEGAAPSRALALGPLAVLPAWQRQGIGGRLVRDGLGCCRTAGEHVVVVLGRPDYYPRFGFAPARRAGLRCEFPAPDDAFMVAELEPGVLRGRTGLVRYHPAFHRV